jgi:hypothetical protein
MGLIWFDSHLKGAHMSSFISRRQLLGGLAVGDFKRRIGDMNAMLDAALPKPSSKAR